MHERDERTTSEHVGSRRAPRASGSEYGGNIGRREKSGEGRMRRGACEGNALFSPPTGPRGFLGYPSVLYTYAGARECALHRVHSFYVRRRVARICSSSGNSHRIPAKARKSKLISSPPASACCRRSPMLVVLCSHLQ